MKDPATYGTTMFSTIFTKASQWTLSCAQTNTVHNFPQYISNALFISVIRLEIEQSCETYGGMDVLASPGAHWIGGWVDPRADLGNMTLLGLEFRPLGRPAP
jgi:hypothetical protein